MRSFDLILQNPTVETRPPCRDVEIDALEGQLSVMIPKVLRDFWKLSNGAVMKDHWATILGVGEVTDLLNGEFADWWREAGFLPVLFDQEASYVCLALRAPLSARVVELQYFETVHLLYRDWASFFEGCVGLLETSNCAHGFFREENGDFGPDADRSADDLEAAALLMQSDEHWKSHLAIQLLDVNSTDAWRKLLNGEIFSRYEARGRLRCMSSTHAKQMLKQDTKEFDEFAMAVRQALENASIGFDYAIGHIWINGQGVDLNLFFGRRHIDNAIPRLLDWFWDVKNYKSPTERIGHYMAD
jgi:hypothetical protein